MATLLIVDDEQSICWGLSRLGEKLGHTVFSASSAEAALEIARQKSPDVLILDVRLPGMDGLTAIEHFRRRTGDIPIIVITAYGDLNTAVEAVRQGAFEYIVKPFDVEQIGQAVQRALAGKRTETADASRVAAVEGFVGRTPVMQQAFNQIALAAASDACILLQGESGTGKELAARAIHKYSARTDGPFVVVNVAALSSTLAESELFGHVRGAFTGADRSRSGLLAEADGGTLFLDEIADIPLRTQIKLLRALEHGEITPVGSNDSIRSDFRVISASHQDLLDRIEKAQFRHDLYFRISAFRITLPPLRDRREDIVPLAEHFLVALAPGTGKPSVISEAAYAELQRRPWQGNVRELRNAIEHAMIVARGGMIEPEHLPVTAPVSVTSDRGNATDIESEIAVLLTAWARAKLSDPEQACRIHEQLLALVEPPVMRAVLSDQSGQFAASARILGLHRTTLRKKMDRYGVEGL